MSDLREVSNKIAAKLLASTDYRLRFQEDPRKVLLEAGVPQDQVPEKVQVDFIELGRSLEKAVGARYRIGEEEGMYAVAVACVVV